MASVIFGGCCSRRRSMIRPHQAVSRRQRSITFSTTLPGAPDGNDATIILDTSFQNKAAAME